MVTRDKDIILWLYMSLVKPQLEYCIQAWKTGESAEKSHKNDSGLQGFELRGKVEEVWTNNTSGTWWRLG